LVWRIDKIEFIKKLHERVKRIKFRNKLRGTHGNTIGEQERSSLRKEIGFGCTWIKIDFLSKRKSKLSPQGDGPFRVLKRVKNNAYRLRLPKEYEVNATFNLLQVQLMIRHIFQIWGQILLKRKGIMRYL